MKSIDEVIVLFPSGWDIQSWPKRHSRGEVPSKLPYGFEGITSLLGSEGISVKFVNTPQKWSERRKLVQSNRLLISWDEHTALKFLVFRKAHVACGIIWASDPPRSTKEKILKPILKIALKRVVFFWCLSHPQKDAVSKWLGVEESKGAFIPFGVDVDFFTPPDIRHETMLLSIGSDRDRDPETLLEAFRKVKEQCPWVSFMVQTPANVQAPKGIEIIKSVSHLELRSLYRKATLCVVATKPNLHVSGMTVSLEAMASGCPPVVTGTAGIEDYVIDEVNGLVAPIQNPSELATNIINLISRPDEIRRLANAGREFVVKERNTEQTMRALSSKILSVIGKADEILADS